VEKEQIEINLPRDLVIPTKLAFSKDIDSDYKFLFAYISYRASTRGYIWYQNETLATHIGKSTRSVERGLKALADAKWIKIENRVKKGSLYHQDMRRAIWIYSDYLVALDKGGYGVARPLAFSTWKKRFIAALIDGKNIPLVMHFFPTANKMGDMGVTYDSNGKYLFSYILNSEKKYITRKLDAKEAEKTYKELYDFYCSLHKQSHEKQSHEKNYITDFGGFQNFIREDYVDKTIAILEDKKVTVNGLGLLMKIDENDNTIQLDTDTAIQLWQWLYQNQDQIIED